jgi:hypothetical protein
VFALLVCLLSQTPDPDVRQLSVHELVREIPRFGDHSWDLSREKERPLSVRAQDELRERIRQGAVLDLADWQTILLEKGFLQHRELWPKSEPFAVGLHVPPLDVGIAIRLAPRTLGWLAVTASAGRSGGCMGGGGPEWQPLGTLFYSDREALFDLEVTTPLWWRTDARGERPVRNDRLGPIRISVQAVRHLEDAVPRVFDRDLDNGIRQLLAGSLCVVVESDRGKPASACVRIGLAEHPQGVLLALELSAFEGGRVHGSAELSLGTTRLAAPESVLEVPAAAVLSKEAARKWTLRITGSDAQSLREWDATQYWGGQIEIPLADLIRH